MTARRFSVIVGASTALLAFAVLEAPAAAQTGLPTMHDQVNVALDSLIDDGWVVQDFAAPDINSSVYLLTRSGNYILCRVTGEPGDRRSRCYRLN
ncbi:MAG: hypothetical protein RID91_18000 [Azospirillaceae bacterium]